MATWKFQPSNSIFKFCQYLKNIFRGPLLLLNLHNLKSPWQFGNQSLSKQLYARHCSKNLEYPRVDKVTPPMKVRLLAGKKYIINTQQSKRLILHYKHYRQKLEQGTLGRTRGMCTTGLTENIWLLTCHSRKRQLKSSSANPKAHLKITQSKLCIYNFTHLLKI